ncbi:nuclease-related domain-containing protein [Thiomicrorhabdus aquaedulcis]|uniref:nuclease-related domain-containing protein n=1 Tax=Thiomicrorhabdus aquaedulcis TaxID=2211106 RepID=UPI000FD78B30|nr:nuclease-related domain-containing protein [Thiomicrorhabdus aquaedulcis]
MDSQFKEVTSIRGLAAEYHVNNTLNRELGAVRYTPYSQGDSFLFDGILIPTPVQDRRQPFTEIDHLYVSKRGVFAIETKSISGKVYGEKDSKKWNSAQASSFKKDGLYDRGFTNPFRQNAFHVSAINNLFKEACFKAWINNYVVLVDANEYGWEQGHWGGDKVDGLFLSAKELAAHILTMPDKLTHQEVLRIAKLLHIHYTTTKDNMAEFKLHHAD